jgi:hypothetical protein
MASPYSHQLRAVTFWSFWAASPDNPDALEAQRLGTDLLEEYWTPPGLLDFIIR